MSVPDNPFLDESRPSPPRPFQDEPPSSSSTSRPRPNDPPLSSSPPYVESRYPPQPHPYPRITQAPPSPTGSSHSNSPIPSGIHSAPANILLREGGGSTLPKGAQGRRVQWPDELASHVSIPVIQSPQTLEDLGAKEALTKALEEHLGGEPRPSFAAASGQDLESQPPSEGTTRAPSEISEGDYQEIRDQMDIYVDPDERDGMPSVHPETEQRDNQRAAVNLVRAHTSGRFGFMRSRAKTAAAAAKDKAKVEETEDEEKNEDGTGAFGRRLRDLAPPRENVDDVPPPRAGGPKQHRGMFSNGGGVLSSLLALQGGGSHARGGSTPSIASSTLNGGSSRASSLMTYGDSDSEEDEEARLKFTRENRMRRGMQAGWMTSGGMMTPGGSIGPASHKPKHASSPNRQSPEPRSGDRTPISATDPRLARRSMEANGGHQRSQSSLSQFLTNRTSYHAPASPSEGNTPPLEANSLSPNAGRKSASNPIKELGKGMKVLGGKVGLEFDTHSSRPSQAKSSAGVFGGLIAATGNISGIATPAGSSIAPNASRPGYHLSRFSANKVETLSDSKTRPTSVVSSNGRASGETTSDHASPNHSLHQSTSRDPLSPTPPNAAKLPPAPPPLVHSLSNPTPTLSSGLASPPLNAHELVKSPSPVHTSSFAENARKRRPPSGMKQIEQFTLGMITHPLKMAKSKSMATTPDGKNAEFDYFGAEAHHGKHKEVKVKETEEEREKREWEKEKKRRRKIKEKKRQEEIFITMHVAAILSRQDFILKLARALMMFGAPSHRLEAQMQATARVLDLNCQMVYIPGVMLVSFGDPATHTSETKFLKQANGLDLGKLLSAHMLYWNVVHDKMGVNEASTALDILMTSKPTYNIWWSLLIGGLCSAFIQPSAFYGSFIDCLIAIPLGMILVLVQVAVSKNDLYSSLFEIVVATINSFLAAALASTGQFCFAAVASGSVVLILPGYIVLCGSLELGNRSIISGSVRLVYSLLYSLFLGFGLAMGSEVYIRVTGLTIKGASDYQCTALRADAPWYRATIPPWFFFISIPGYLMLLGMRNGQPLLRKETFIMVLVGSAGFVCNYFAGKVFVGRSDITSTIGSFVVGILGGLYAKFTKGSAFVVMVVGILLQLPSGLSNGGLLQFASESTSGDTDAYSSGFEVAKQLVSVAIGLTVGLFVSAAVVNMIGGGRRRGANLSSF